MRKKIWYLIDAKINGPKITVTMKMPKYKQPKKRDFAFTKQNVNDVGYIAFKNNI